MDSFGVVSVGTGGCGAGGLTFGGVGEGALVVVEAGVGVEDDGRVKLGGAAGVGEEPRLAESKGLGATPVPLGAGDGGDDESDGTCVVFGITNQMPIPRKTNAAMT